MGDTGPHPPAAGDRCIADRGKSSRSTLDRGYQPGATGSGSVPDLIADGPVSKQPSKPPTPLPPGLASEPPLQPLRTWSGRYMYPVASPYRRPGDTWDAPRSGGRRHHGIDIAAPAGTKVRAITDGFVTLLANWRGAGLTIRLEADDGRGYEYMHLRSFSPYLRTFFNPPDHEPDKRWTIRRRVHVSAGTDLGEVGNTGAPKVTAHLHFQAFRDHRCRLDVRNPNIAKRVDERWNPFSLLERIQQAGGKLDVGVVSYGEERRPVATPAPATPKPLEGSVETGWFRRGAGTP